MRWLQPLARPRFILFFLGLFIACQIVFFFLFQALAAQGVSTTLDMMTGFTPGQARAHFEAYTPAAFLLLNWFQLTDLVFPSAYGLFFASLSFWLLGKLFPSSTRVGWVCLVPLVGAGCDLLENTGIFIMARVYPGDIQTLAVLTGAAGIVKNVLFLGGVLLAVTLSIIYLMRRVLGNARKPTP